jgi:hypothetical protein
MVVPELNCFMILIMKNPTLIGYIHTHSKRLMYTLQDQPINHVKFLKSYYKFENVTTRVVSNFHSIKN